MRSAVFGRAFPGVKPLPWSLLLACVLGGGCASPPAPRSPRVPVTVAEAQARSMPFALSASGTVEPIQSAQVGSQVGGVVTRIVFREGDEVAKGRPLIELDARPFRAALQQALALMARDRAQAHAARLDAERWQKLFAEGVVAPADLEQKRSAAEALAAAVQGDSAAAAKARLDLENAIIRAPIAGRTGNLHVHVGDYVKAATSDPLVTVNQLRPIRVRFALPQADIPNVQRYREKGARVMVRTSPDDSTEIAGQLVFVDNAVDPATGTLLLKGEFPNLHSTLWPGEFVEVRLVLTTQHNAIVVPATAISTGQQGTYVYVLNADSTASARPVTVERSDDVSAIVGSGLRPGEVVITDGQFRLSPGARVIVRAPHRGGRP